ncbi:MAG TPA: hypothetical protein PLL30_09665 [Candidatus Krumholzibacteria bacterium]|nr:hypothetical protein [Candidatus Krumholzibacteria bacterium]HPD72030.1 hypothetical protein [Candidatus Krumholzibacteria bacterium]HRY41037.1 hypothetical protein [Candidatus Krumholzibacteria bacterium]
MSIKRVYSVLTVATVLAVALVGQAPAQSIDDVAGVVSNGNSITIHGSGFGDRDHQQPYCWEDFEGASCQLDTTANNVGLYQGRLSQLQAYSGNQSIELRHGDPDIETESPAERQGWAYYRFPRELQGGDEIFMMFWERWSWGCWWCDDPENSQWEGPATQSYQIKNWRVSSGSHYVTPPDIVHTAQSDCNDWGTPEFTPRYLCTDINVTTWYSRVFADGNGGYEHTLPHHTWILWEVMIRQSSPGVNDGANIVWIARNGKSARIVNETNATTHQPGQPGFNKVSLGDWIDSFGRSTTQYYDDFYFDMGWQRVVIGDRPTWDACTVRDIQPYTTWTDDTIVVTVNTPSFQDGQQGYLYYVGPNGSPADMEPVTITAGGGGDDDGPPGAPSPVVMTPNGP